MLWTTITICTSLVVLVVTVCLVACVVLRAVRIMIGEVTLIKLMK